jgi:signal recognition particle receptor subunit beta
MTLLYVYVTGSDGSGKTRLLSSLGNKDDFSIDEGAGIEYRQFTVDETLELCVLCAQDASRFDQLLQIPQRDLLGYIVLVDSTDFDSWSMARIIMANCRGYALLPTIIAANKQDLPGAYTPEQVGGWMGMESMMRVQGCVATDPPSARNVFLQLLYAVSSEIERLDVLISQIEELTAEAADEE